MVADMEEIMADAYYGYAERPGTSKIDYQPRGRSYLSLFDFRRQNFIRNHDDSEVKAFTKGVLVK